MSTRARKQRKRSGVKWSKPVKTPTYRPHVKSLGLMSTAELMSRMLAGGLL